MNKDDIENNGPAPKTPEEVPSQPATEPEITPHPEPPKPEPTPQPAPTPGEPIPSEPNESEKIRRERDFRPQMKNKV